MQSINDICENYSSKQVDQDTLEVAFHDLTWPALQSLPTDGLVCVCLTQCAVTCLLRTTAGSKNLRPIVKICLLNITFYYKLHYYYNNMSEKLNWKMVFGLSLFYFNCLFLTLVCLI